MDNEWFDENFIYVGEGYGGNGTPMVMYVHLSDADIVAEKANQQLRDIYEKGTVDDDVAAEFWNSLGGQPRRSLWRRFYEAMQQYTTLQRRMPFVYEARRICRRIK